MPRSLLQFVLFAPMICIIFLSDARADEAASASSPIIESADEPSLKDKAINLLPPAISDGLEIDAWGWFADTQNNQNEYSNYYDIEVGLGITKTFDQRVTISAQGNFIDANDTRRGELEQGYASVLLSENSGTILTVGKFNANFGVEARDFWNRTTGTTSVIFGAQPQDLVGVMFTQPLGKTGIILRPFVSTDFQGQFYFNQSPSAGISAEYRASHELVFGATQWIGPGVVLFGGRPFHSPYRKPEYGEGSSVVTNWQGPNLQAETGGTIYFSDLKATWQARPDLCISAEYLVATTSTSHGHWGWWGCMLLADYDITNKWHGFGRYSFLDDSNWLVTGIFQRYNEFSAGLGYEILKGLEVRGEYRHDIGSVSGDVDSVSIHLTFTY